MHLEATNSNIVFNLRNYDQHVTHTKRSNNHK